MKSRSSYENRGQQDQPRPPPRQAARVPDLQPRPGQVLQLRGLDRPADDGRHRLAGRAGTGRSRRSVWGRESSPNKYTTGHMTCDAWKSGHLGAVDAPPNYGEETRAAYEREETSKHALYHGG